MPIYNPLTGNKRRRRTFETSRSRRSQALDATDSMLLQLLQDSIINLMETKDFFYFITHFLAFFFFTIHRDDNVTRQILFNFSLFTLDLIDRIRTLLMIDSAHGDIHPQNVLPRGHSLKPRNHMSIQQFTSDDECLLATGFRVTELTTIKNFFRMEEAQDIDGFIRIQNYR
jgi:hypothetical protein